MCKKFGHTFGQPSQDVLLILKFAFHEWEVGEGVLILHTPQNHDHA